MTVVTTVSALTPLAALSALSALLFAVVVANRVDDLDLGHS